MMIWLSYSIIFYLISRLLWESVKLQCINPSTVLICRPPKLCLLKVFLKPVHGWGMWMLAHPLQMGGKLNENKTNVSSQVYCMIQLNKCISHHALWHANKCWAVDPNFWSRWQERRSNVRGFLVSRIYVYLIKQIANGSKNKSAACIIFFNASFITSWLGSVKGDTRQCHMAAACKWPPDLKYRCILAHLTSYSKPLSGVHLRSAKYSHNPVDRWHWFKQNCERRHIHSRSSWEAVISIWKPVSPGASAFL